MKISRGFTLIEVLLTIGALTLLFVALAVVIDPAVELQKIRDTRRAAQVDTIYGALENYFAVNGTYPQGVLQLDNGSSIEICASGIPQATCQNDGLLFLSGALEPDFISQLPTDSQATGNTSGFSIHKNASGQVGISAPLVEFRDAVVAGAELDSGVTFMSANGGTESTINISSINYRVHVFTASGSLTVTEPGTVEYLIVGGGGGGGLAINSNRSGGGGGAGGVLSGTIDVTAQSYPIVVGAGGNGALGDSSTGEEVGDIRSGEDSTFAGLTAIGGGGGGNGGAGNGANGGSGGGAGRNDSTNFGLGTSGQGNNGGGGWPGGTSSSSGAGGGGGAGEVGQNAISSAGGGGGDGVTSNITGSNIFYAGGGGGARMAGNGGSGGQGGGGAGASAPGNGQDGSANTGGGGGGAASDGNGGNGGSGIVIIRYPIES